MVTRISEKEWRQLVVDYAHLMGWRVYFTWRSVHSPAGYPDLTMVRRDRLIVAELKTETGKLSAEQIRWLTDLDGVPGVETFTWRPSAWVEVRDVLA